MSPFQSFVDNLALMINESVYLVLILSLLYYHDSSKWNSTVESLYIGLIMSNNLAISIIYLGSAIFSVCIKIKNCCKKKDKPIETKPSDDQNNEMISSNQGVSTNNYMIEESKIELAIKPSTELEKLSKLD